ncbi:Uncharacterised protein [Vibrio cholerae]|uniref:Uncharacterized protein n=1 Tax=Vibrio cholerae TaxID=666 RepID=A0A655ZIC1_VIBCL|nr:Uncharacterised protein [Vibrio cholerae]CSC70441.1 Uncharacterised protein [Vibrio cholerae]
MDNQLVIITININVAIADTSIFTYLNLVVRFYPNFIT